MSDFPAIKILFLLPILVLACQQSNEKQSNATENAVIIEEIEKTYSDSLHQIFTENTGYIAKGFDFPVNPPDAKKYYNAQPFGENRHLGDDWNGVGGGNTDLGDPVFAIADGVVVAAKQYGGGWGNVVRIVHCLEKHPTYQFVESVYAHLDKIKIADGTLVKKGQLVGTIGNANGRYWAHLHLELRSDIELPIGGGYSTDTTGYLDPTAFIKANRPK